MNKNQIELTEVEVMEDESPLSKVIETTLVKHNVTNAVISSLKDKYGSLRLKSIDDKESYLEIVGARREVRKVGIITEKICKLGREDANKIQKLWIEKEKEVLAKINKVQSPLEDEIKKFDDEVERKENQEKERQEAAYQQRQATLIKYGATYNNGSFELNHISYEISNIKECDEEVWNDIVLPKYKVEFEKVEAEKVRIEKEREEAALKLKQEQDELRKQQEDMDRQRKELADQMAAMQKIKDDAEREQRVSAQKENDEFIRKHREKIGNRAKQLQGLGLFYNTRYDSYVFEDVAVSRVVEIEGMDDDKWDEMVAKITPTIERNKKELEEKRIADAEEQKKKDIEAALQQERDRVAKEKEDAKLKEAQEKQQRIDELAKAGDKANWAVMIEALKAINLPEMKSGQYRNKIAIVKEKIEEIYSL